ncbi:MAG: response regulator [Deltaproteobacteria bacterium SG8_13]|nr:MAG: response regulator [Deltaproteobacteria bacterium SG8_13]
MARILVLDDVADAVKMMKRILESGGHEVFTFTDEREALDFLSRSRVDLAILDIRLKKMSGLVVLETIKKNHPVTRVMMLTGHPTAETLHESKRLGASEYCVKPIDTHELEKKVAAVLQGENV